MDTTLNAFGIALIVLWALNAFIAILLVGKPRPTGTPRSAAVSVALSATLIVLLLVFGTGKL